MQELKYKIVCNHDFNNNFKMFNSVYSTILSKNSIILYNFLLNECDIINKLGNITTKCSRISKMLQLSNEELIEARKDLEAFGLLKTMIDYNKRDNLIFLLKEALKWDEFRKNTKFYNLLQQKLEPLEFDTLRYCFESNDITTGYSDISETFENHFNIALVEDVSFNFEQLYEKIFKMTGNIIALDKETKILVESYFKNKNISFSEILDCIYRSTYKLDSNILVDHKILKTKLDSIFNSKNISEFNHILKVNRNAKIFLDDVSLENFDFVISDYKTLNSEQYLCSIQKQPLTELELKLINVLKKQYFLPDFLINVLIDYSIVKNNGRIEPLYIQKIASSINLLGIKSVEQLIVHLQKAFKNNSSYNNQNKFDKVNW